MSESGPKSSVGYGRRPMDTQALFGDVRRRVAPNLFTDLDRYPSHTISCYD